MRSAVPPAVLLEEADDIQELAACSPECLLRTKTGSTARVRADPLNPVEALALSRLRLARRLSFLLGLADDEDSRIALRFAEEVVSLIALGSPRERPA